VAAKSRLRWYSSRGRATRPRLGAAAYGASWPWSLRFLTCAFT
jgi:hypothetical protein